MIKINVFLVVLLTFILCLGLVFISCSTDSGGENGGDSGAENKIVYKSDKGDTSYMLEITKKQNRAAFTPEAGDLYKLTITTKGGTPQVSTGTVESYSSSNKEFTLLHSSGATFTVKGTDDGLMTEINGNIPIDGSNETTQAPGAVDVNMVGTTWKADSAIVNGQVVNVTFTETFGQNTITVVVESDDSGIFSNGTYTGTYTVKGTTITASGFEFGNGTYEVVNGNTVHAEVYAVVNAGGVTINLTLIKQ